MSPTNAKQADFPQGAEILPNPIGTAPGFKVSIGDAVAFFMPGVPREMKKLFDEQVMPRILPLAPNDSAQIRLRTFGLPESVVGERLGGVEAAFSGVTIGYRAHFPEIEVKVLARAATNDAARDLCQRATADVRAKLADVIFGEGDDTFAGVTGRALRSRGYTLAIAESCTGGLVGHMITREPGASDFLLLDAVTYANSAKTSLLGVDEPNREPGAEAPVRRGGEVAPRRPCGSTLVRPCDGSPHWLPCSPDPWRSACPRHEPLRRDSRGCRRSVACS